jgi:hypothetical protein
VQANLRRGTAVGQQPGSTTAQAVAQVDNQESLLTPYPTVLVHTSMSVRVRRKKSEPQLRCNTGDKTGRIAAKSPASNAQNKSEQLVNNAKAGNLP